MKHTTTIQFNKDQFERLKKRAEILSIPVGSIIKILVGDYLAKENMKDIVGNVPTSTNQNPPSVNTNPEECVNIANK